MSRQPPRQAWPDDIRDLKKRIDALENELIRRSIRPPPYTPEFNDPRLQVLYEVTRKQTPGDCAIL